MAGKSPLLLAMVLFVIGVSGLALSSAERSHWGPFEPGVTPPPQQVRVVDVGVPYVIPPLEDLLSGTVEATAVTRPETEFVSAPVEEPEPTASPTLTPLRVFGLSTDDAGVSAAAVEPTPPPLKIVNVANDADSTPTPEATADTTETPEPSATAESSETPAAETTPTPEATATPESPAPEETPTPAAN